MYAVSSVRRYNSTETSEVLKLFLIIRVIRVLLVRIQPKHLKYWNETESKTKASAIDLIQPKHLKYWNLLNYATKFEYDFKFNRNIWSIETMNYIGSKYKLSTNSTETSEVLKHHQEDNRYYLLSQFNRNIWSIETFQK